MASILDDIDPSEIHYLHLITEQGQPSLSIAHRIPVTDVVVTDSYVQFTNPRAEDLTVRVDRRRIMLVEYGEFTMPELELSQEDD